MTKGRSGLPHPLDRDEHTLDLQLLHEPLLRGTDTTVRNLILENTSSAKAAMQSYREGRRRGRADAYMLQSILAVAELHRAGLMYPLVKGEKPDLTAEEEAVYKKATELFDDERLRASITTEYGLDRFEVKAIQEYSDADNDKVDRIIYQAGTIIGKELNPTYMGVSQMWSYHLSGWNALTSALHKLPSLGDLGIELTTYRVSRDQTEAAALAHLPTEANVLHGRPTDKLSQGHFASTAVAFSHFMLRALEAGGIMAITGYSGRYINPFGKQGIGMDGGEILYPPGFLSRYEGPNAKGAGYRDGSQEAPVFHMREIRAPEQGQLVVDDRDFKVLKAKDPGFDLAKEALRNRIQQWLELSGGPALFDEVRQRTDVYRSLAYLTMEELAKLSVAIQERQGLDVLLADPEKMSAAQRIFALMDKHGQQLLAGARAVTGISGDLLNLSVPQLQQLENWIKTEVVRALNRQV